MILDATAANRFIWCKKDSESVIWIDIEKNLEVKPTIYADNSQSPFLPKFFDTIIFDPPHGWGGGNPIYLYPDAETYNSKFSKPRLIPTYYGWDKFKNHWELIGYLYKAQKEFYRILKDDGMLWFKWNTIRISLHRALSLFELWHIMMEISVKSPTQSAGNNPTYWVCMMKKKVDYVQSILC